MPPLPYKRDFSFSGYQANVPGAPLPGPRLDIELDRVAAVLSRAGASAYQLAVLNGFVGTEAQFLASLVGPPGAALDAAGVSALLPNVTVTETGGVTKSVPAAFAAKAPVLGTLTANGTADDRAPLASADGTMLAGEWQLRPGVIRIASNITLSAHYRIPRGVILKPDNGVTVTFTAGLTAGDYKIFDTSAGGAIAGLAVSNVEWFTDKGGTTSDCTADVQKAYDACVSSALVLWPAKKYYFAGSTAVQVVKGQRTSGAGRANTVIAFPGTARNAFKFTGTAYGSFMGFSFYAVTPGNIAQPSVVLDVQAGFMTIRDLRMTDVYIGIQHANCVGGDIASFDLDNCVASGVICTNGNDVFLSNFFVSSVSDIYEFSSVAGTFSQGETVTFKSGATTIATGVILEPLGANKYRINTAYVAPSAGNTVSGNTSGATATLATVTLMHQLGGLRLTDHIEAVSCLNGDVIGGQYSMIITAASRGAGISPNFNKFTNMFFDTSKMGVRLTNCIGTTFANTWICSHGSNNVTCSNTLGMHFISCESMNAQNNGYQFSSTCSNYKITGGFAANNNGSGIFCYGSNFTIQGVDCSARPIYPTANQQYGIVIDSACSNFKILDNDVANNISGNIFDQTPGTTVKRIVGNMGYKTTNRVTVTIPVGQTVGAVAHGLPFTPADGDITFSDQSRRSTSGISAVWTNGIADATNVKLQCDTAVTGTPYRATVDICPPWAA